MKRILIATDFSAASRNACLYGLQLGEALGAKIILFSAYYMPNRMPSLNVGISEFSIMKETEDKLAQEVLYLKKYSALPIEIVCDKGIPQVAIKNISIEKNVDFIIIGMKGAGHNFRKVFGSTVTELIKIIHTPVFIIPGDANFNTPKKIVFASDLNSETDPHAIDGLVSFATFFHSKLFLVKVIQNEGDEESERGNISPELKQSLTLLDTTFEYPVDKDISHALNDSITRHDANLVVMIPHNHDWLDLVFKRSETRQMIYHSHTPILTFPHTRSN